MDKVDSVQARGGLRPIGGLNAGRLAGVALWACLLSAAPAGAAGGGASGGARIRAAPATSARTLVVEAAPASRRNAGQKVLTLREPPVEAFVLSSDSAAKAVDLSKGSVKLEKGELLLNKTVDEPRLLASRNVRPGATAPALALPYEMHFLDSAGEKRTCELVAEVGSGFRIASTGRLFVAELYVALKDRSDWTKSYDLPQAVQVLVTAAVDELAPKLLSLQKTNTWQAITLGEDSPDDTVMVKIRPALDSAGLELKVPVIRPRLSLTLNPGEIQGFGLDVAKIVVTVNGAPNTAGRAVTLNASAGRLSATRLVLDAEGTAESTVRSEGTGPLTVTVQGVGAASARADGRFLWPIEFVMSALLGALAGTLVSFLRLRSTISQDLRQSLKEIGGGVLLGMLTAVAYAAGVNVLGIELPTFGGEALVFTAAALGAVGLGGKFAAAAKSGEGATATQGR